MSDSAQLSLIPKLVLPRARKSFWYAGVEYLLKACWCTVDHHIDLADYLWNPPQSPWYSHEGCYCRGTHWVCASCGGQKWHKSDQGAIPCAVCQVETKVEIKSEDASGKPRNIQAVKIVEALWLVAFRKSVDAAQARELMRAVKE